MAICEYYFDHPDPKKPNYGSTEWDIYSWIPAHPDIANHRLSIRKNLLTGEYEVYRHFIQQLLVKRAAGIMIHNESAEKLDQVAFKNKSLQAILDFTNEECAKYHGESQNDQVCQHSYPQKAALCKGRRELQEDYVVEIFQDPVTCSLPEGLAKLIKLIRTEPRKQFWRVTFLSDQDKGEYGRWIKT